MQRQTPPDAPRRSLRRREWLYCPDRAVSSAVEHCFHTAGVTGSIPVPPTNKIK
jgi:hypothetical protein